MILQKASIKIYFPHYMTAQKEEFNPRMPNLLSELERDEDAGEAARLAGMDTAIQDPAELLRDCAGHMRQRRIERHRNELRDALKSASGDDKRKLLAEIGRLDKELNLQDR